MTVTTIIAPPTVLTAVLAVLSGVPVSQAATDAALRESDLADAVDLYHAAGQAALHHRTTTSWFQVRIQFRNWGEAEHVAVAHLGPRLRQAEDVGVLRRWWFIRKAPSWRLRCQPVSPDSYHALRDNLTTVLDGLLAAGPVTQWAPTIYEPETFAFGGDEAMDISHDLFHADSAGVLDYLGRQARRATANKPIGRRELSILLCTSLFRAARQEWHEQADIWHRVGQLRPMPADVATEDLASLTASLRTLIAADTTNGGGLFATHEPLAAIATWNAALQRAGRRLGDAAADGVLQRGLRDVLAHHVIFMWNRFGVPSRAQIILAQAARDTMMNPPPMPTGPRQGTDVAATHRP